MGRCAFRQWLLDRRGDRAGHDRWHLHGTRAALVARFYPHGLPRVAVAGILATAVPSTGIASAHFRGREGADSARSRRCGSFG